MRIIGYGNLQRGDDGLGIIAAEKLRAQGLDAVSLTGDGLELVEAWRGIDDAIVVDAVVTGAPAGTIHRLDGRQPLLTFGAPTSTHGMGLAQAIELARTLDLLPVRLWIWGIEGKCFDAGTEISPEVKSAVEKLTQEINARVTPSQPLR
jgi:hydrogenase maturation protease